MAMQQPSPSSDESAASTPTGGSAAMEPRQVVDQTQEKMSQVVDQVRQLATSQLTKQLAPAAQSVQKLGSRTQAVGQELRADDQQWLAQYADQAAQQLERFSSYLRDADAEQLIGEVEGLVRRRPVLLLGGALAVGLIATRLFKPPSQPISTTEGQTPATS